MRVYRKPERENKLQRSTVGSFVLPFDPATVKSPSIKMELRSDLSVVTQDQPLALEALLLSQHQDDVDAPVVPQQDTDNLDAETGGNLLLVGVDDVVDNERGSLALIARYKPSDNEVVELDIEGDMYAPSEPRERELADFKDTDGDVAGLYSVSESVVADFGDRKGDTIEEDFLPSHVEVAEYSDREFEAEMEDALEEVQQAVAVAEEGRCHNIEPMEVEEAQQGGSITQGSNPQNNVCMEVEEVQFGNAGCEEIIGGNVCAEGEKVLLGSTGGGGSRGGNDEKVLEAGKYVILGVAEVQPGGDAAAEETKGERHTFLEAEEVQRPNVIADEVRADNVFPGLEEAQQGEIAEDTQFESIVSLETESIQQEDTATVETCDSDVSLHAEETNDLANVKESVSQQRLVSQNQAEDTSAEVENTQLEEKATSNANHEDEVYPGTDSLENVNSLVEGKGDTLDYSDGVKPEENAALVDEEIVVGEEGRVELEVVLSSEAVKENSVMEETYDGQSVDEIRNELSSEALVSEDSREAAGDTSLLGEKVETLNSPMIEVLEREGEASIRVDTVEEELTQMEGMGDAVDDVSLNMGGEDDRVQLPEDRQLSNDMQLTDLTEEHPSAVVLEPEHRLESNGKLKEIEEENPSAQEQEPPVTVVEVQEHLPRQLRKRRASSRLLANAEAHAQQEAAQGQASVGVKNKGGAKGAGKRATKGTTRTSQRRSKRRGSTH